MDLSQHYDQVARCNRCGFCQVDCPVFRSTGHEAGVARGRIALLRALIEKRAEWSPAIEEQLFECLGCGACQKNCPPAIATADLIRAARREYLEQTGRGPIHRLLFDRLLPYPRRLRWAARAAAFGKRAGLSKVAKALGLLRIFGRDLPKAEGIVERFPPAALRQQVETGELAGEGDSLRIGYFVGCGTDIMTPGAGEAAISLLRGIGKTVTVLDNCCCGLPPETYGDREAARVLARKNLEQLDYQAFDLIVTDCSSCASFLKEHYPKLFEQDDPAYAAAGDFASRVRDLVEVLAARSHWPGDSEPIIATYHDPCHAVRGQGIFAEPRDILRSLPGVEYREMPEASWCCGGAGSYALSHYERSRQVLDRKIDNVEKTGANVLVTSCPACIIQLSYGVRLRGLNVQVRHLAEVVAQCGGEKEGRVRCENGCSPDS